MDTQGRHQAWMRRALQVAGGDAPLARSAASAALAGSPPTGVPAGLDSVGGRDVPIGAVVFGPDGDELATGRNEREATGDPTAHAEVVALRAACRRRGSWRLDGCTMVVTVEPCTMCAGAVVLARVATLVFGAWEPKTGAVGSLWDVVRDRRLNHRPEVYAGVLAEDAAGLMRAFFASQRTGGPDGDPAGGAGPRPLPGDGAGATSW